MSSSCLFTGPIFTDPTACATRIHQLLPVGPLALEVFYPGTAAIPWALAGIPERATSLSFNMHCDSAGIVQYHAVKCANPSGLASALGNPVPLVSNSRTYRSMYSYYIRAQAPDDMTSGSISAAMNTFLVNWNTNDGRPGDYAPASVNQTAANAAQVVLASQSTSTAFNAVKDNYFGVMGALTTGQYAFIDVTDPMSFAYVEIDTWEPILIATPCNWILRCNGEPNILAYFQNNPAYIIETINDGVSTLIRNF